MALTITAASVQASSTATLTEGVAGTAQTITPGQPVYRSTSDGLIYLANNAANATAQVEGISIDKAFAGQPVRIVTKDPAFAVGNSAMSKSNPLVLGTAGLIENSGGSDSVWNTFLGWAINTTHATISVVIAPAARVAAGANSTFTNSSTVATSAVAKLWSTVAAAQVQAGYLVARNPSDGTVRTCNANVAAGNWIGNVFGVALNEAEVGQPVSVAVSDANLVPAYSNSRWTAGQLIYATGTAGTANVAAVGNALGLNSFVGFVTTGGGWKLSPVNSGVVNAT
jgi:hypothetical protein